MSKKRRKFNKNSPVSPRRAAKRKIRRGSRTQLCNELLSYVYRSSKPLSLNDIFTGIPEYAGEKRELRAAVEELLGRKELVSAGKKRFRINDNSNIYSGKLEKNPRGFGFVIDLQPRTPNRPFVKDPFLTVGRVGNANHGDTLLIRILRVRRDGRPEAEIISILERSKEQLCGFFRQGNPPYIIPEDPRMPAVIQLIDDYHDEIADGDAVIAQIVPQPHDPGRLYGKIAEVLGPPQNIDVQMRMVVEKHALPHVFSDKAGKEAEVLFMDTDDISTREDLRSIAHITIDGETAKDFDDAIAVEKMKKGYRLYVSIADVSFFVRPGTAIDKEAYERGTSIYFPGRVIPMLPERLSNNLCSLVPHEDRFTFTAVLDFDRSGNRLSTRFCKSIICSRHRFTYTTVQKILIDKDSGIRSDHKQFLTPLKWAAELAEVLHDKRMERGSIGFNIPAAEVSLEEDGNIRSIQRAQRNFAHMLIEEFMLAANEAVAYEFTENKAEFIYRIHEKPEPERVKEFSEFARSLGIELPPPSSDPSWFGKVLDIVKDSPTEYVVNNLLLRTMQQARYDNDNQGHFGLAATDYTHFTSPIRRYPDLIVHRLLENLLSKKKKRPDNPASSLKEKANFLSTRERVATSAEREMDERLKLFFMEKFVGQTFEAIISGVNEHALFLELLDIFVSGSIDISRLNDDYYLYDAKRYRLIGESGGKIYQLGDPLQVTLTDVDHKKKRIHFVPADTEVSS